MSVPQASRRVAQILLLACLFATFSLPVSIPSRAQESSVWLPRNLEAEHSESIKAVAQHALTRQGCENILEAKLGDPSAEDTKFIVTCETLSGASVNLVYWSSDVASEFANVTYLPKSEAVTEGEEPLLVLSEETVKQTLADCRAAFTAQPQGRTTMLIETHSSVQVRPSQAVVTFLEFSTKAQPEKTAYTATCLSRENRALKIEVFTQQ